MVDKIKTRIDELANYKSVFFKGNTIRIPLDKSKPITELKYPEFYDVSLGTYCDGGCKYCYASGNKKGVYYKNVAQKIYDYFGPMTENQRPYQVALGGSSDPITHPEFDEVLKAFYNLGIVPNYTTNGKHLNFDVVESTKKYCGGIAITAHEHLKEHWTKAIELAIQNKLRVNIHYIISDSRSIDQLKQIYQKYNGKIDYFVLLPYMNVGFASKFPKTIDYINLEKWLDEIHSFGNIAFGSKFYEFLIPLKKWGVSLYPPEIFSKYLMCDDDMNLYNNSFEMKRV